MTSAHRPPRAARDFARRRPTPRLPHIASGGRAYQRTSWRTLAAPGPNTASTPSVGGSGSGTPSRRSRRVPSARRAKCGSPGSSPRSVRSTIVGHGAKRSRMSTSWTSAPRSCSASRMPSTTPAQSRICGAIDRQDQRPPVQRGYGFSPPSLDRTSRPGHTAGSARRSCSGSCRPRRWEPQVLGEGGRSRGADDARE